MNFPYITLELVSDKISETRKWHIQIDDLAAVELAPGSTTTHIKPALLNITPLANKSLVVMMVLLQMF